MAGKGLVSQFPATGSCYDIMKMFTHFSARFVSYGSEKASWTEARATCESLDSELVVLNDKYEADWVGSR